MYLEDLSGGKMRMFTDPAVRQAIEEFQNNLKEISRKIKERNRQLPVSYDYLIPENIPLGVSV